MIQDGLNLQRIDADAAAFDHVLFSADDIEVAVFVEISQVAGVKPSVAKRRVCGRGIFIIPLRRERTLG
jgi:hypothetical protein